MTTSSPNPDDVTTRLRATGEKLCEAYDEVMDPNEGFITIDKEPVFNATCAIDEAVWALNARDATIDLLRRQLAERDAALKPFADLVPGIFDDGYQDVDGVSIGSYHGELDLTLTVADFRRARSALGEPQ